MKIVRAAIISLLIAPSVASAASIDASSGWQFAKWGMTPAQLRAASHGTVRPGESAGYDLLDGETSFGSFRFKVTFGYQPRREDPGNNALDNLVLSGVGMTLDQKSGTCRELAAYLRKLFGMPDRTTSEEPAGYIWHRKDLGDDIDYYSWPDKSCGVQYSPLDGS